MCDDVKWPSEKSTSEKCVCCTVPIHIFGPFFPTQDFASVVSINFYYSIISNKAQSMHIIKADSSQSVDK